MSRFSSDRLSPALVISLIALFVALGGTAWAVSGGKIGTSQIKANAVTAKKIKRGAVRTGKLAGGAVTNEKIANGTITGAKIVAGTLGTVPNATNAFKATTADTAKAANSADHAKSATRAERANQATEAEHANSAGWANKWSRFHGSGVVTAAPGQIVDLGSEGPYAFQGRCIDKGASVSRAEIVLVPSEATFMNSASAHHLDGESILIPIETALLGEPSEGDDTEWNALGDGTSWTATTTDGNWLLEGNANTGVNVFGRSCAFEVSWLSLAVDPVPPPQPVPLPGP